MHRFLPLSLKFLLPSRIKSLPRSRYYCHFKFITGVAFGPRSSIGPDSRPGGGEALRQQLPSKFEHYVSARVDRWAICASPKIMWQPLKVYFPDDRPFSLPKGSTIKLHTLSGGEIDEGCGLPKQVICTPRRIDALDLSELFAVAFSRAVQVPDDCISFSWSRDGDQSFQVVVVFIPLSVERRFYLTIRNLSPSPGGGPGVLPTLVEFATGRTWANAVCQVCASPRSEEEFNNVKAETCSLCTPRWLCYRCKVKVRGGEVKCYLCLTEEEFVQASEDHPHESLRLKLLTGPWPAAVEDDEFNDRASRSSSEASASTMRSSSEAPAPKRPRRQREAIDDEASAPTRG